MAQEEPGAILYDFLFIDQARIRSLYAQLFSGFLAGMEKLVAQREKSGLSLQIGGAPIAAGIKSNEREASRNSAEHIDPHDLILHDVLEELSDRGMICRSPHLAVPGNLVLLEGKVGILDFKTVEGFTAMLPELLHTLSPPGRRKGGGNQAEVKRIASLIRGFAALVPWGVTVLFQNDAITAWGAIKREALRAEPGNLVLQSGPVLTGEWSMLALVDVPPHAARNTIDGLPDMPASLLESLDGMRDAVGMPNTCLGVTPLLVFRKVLPPLPESGQP